MGSNLVIKISDFLALERWPRRGRPQEVVQPFADCLLKTKSSTLYAFRNEERRAEGGEGRRGRRGEEETLTASPNVNLTVTLTLL